eukprot:12114341-Alexandrium_andersonii.AAC.1
MDFGSVQIMSIASPAREPLVPECVHTQRARAQGRGAEWFCSRGGRQRINYLKYRAAMAIAAA